MKLLILLTLLNFSAYSQVQLDYKQCIQFKNELYELRNEFSNYKMAVLGEVLKETTFNQSELIEQLSIEEISCLYLRSLECIGTIVSILNLRYYIKADLMHEYFGVLNDNINLTIDKLKLIKEIFADNIKRVKNFAMQKNVNASITLIDKFIDLLEKNK